MSLSRQSIALVMTTKLTVTKRKYTIRTKIETETNNIDNYEVIENNRASLI